ncbi:MAG: bifunctional pyr operon transcriptional regulator/uracil phosphoribosyltransferase PyrR [bacterium]
MEPKKLTVDQDGVNRIITRMAHEIIEKNQGAKELCIIGIRTRGVHVGERIARIIKKTEDIEVPFGLLDITLYRDDVGSIGTQPIVKETKIPFDINDKTIILVDDVLFTGRSIRAALDAIMDFGRPKCIKLAVLIDRGHRELPIRADFVGKKVFTSLKETVEVNLKEIDNIDRIRIVNQK